MNIYIGAGWRWYMDVPLSLSVNIARFTENTLYPGLESNDLAPIAEHKG